MIELEKALISKIALQEGLPEEFIISGVSAGTITVMKNRVHDIEKPCAVGKGLFTKVNANIGVSSGNSDVDLEIGKMKMAVSFGADTIMDLSTGEDVTGIRKRILRECPVPLGTVPVYELACSSRKKFLSMEEDDFLDVLRKQAEEGVDFFTVHSGITLESVNWVKKNPRIMNIVSRGGALLASWMEANRRENPFFSMFDDVVKIAREYGVVLSLGDSLRPGAVSDATDRLQVQELLILGDLQQRALSMGVQVIIEGPGHVPLDQIEANVKLEKSICHGAPFYVLGPLVTDAAPGYDHITGAIGGAIAAWHGADFLCYVTPAEHLRLPDEMDVKNGVIASKIAAHAADIAKGNVTAISRDKKISQARARRDWEGQFSLALDPVLPREMRKSAHPKKEDMCTMCSEYCSIKITEESLLAGKGETK
ncbi:MAG TPA: phosphomethylpyrimidine synthase ThiC [Candidatus Omnitrophota bacterium]|nr:phosphomethylpyrimidine synthase ThiC [Candidatus Omnitrophota bacterium]